MLDVPGVVDLILYGSQARHSTTGYSDVDAILVVTDQTAHSPAALRELRPVVMSAQRHVLRYQPMQHHGFEVVTPALLSSAASALQLPAEALAHTATLLGRSTPAAFDHPAANDARARFELLARQLGSVRTWPRHPWNLHGVLSMFELLPVLFLQSTGERVEKWRSFEIARERFPGAWQPYETLENVRERWPKRRHRMMRSMLRSAKNPWVVVDVWRRGPVVASDEIRSLLTPSTLDDLHVLIDLMRRG